MACSSLWCMRRVALLPRTFLPLRTANQASVTHGETCLRKPLMVDERAIGEKTILGLQLRRTVASIVIDAGVSGQSPTSQHTEHGGKIRAVHGAASARRRCWRGGLFSHAAQLASCRRVLRSCYCSCLCLCLPAPFGSGIG